MKRIFFTLTLLVLAMWQVQAQTIHWLLFIDTKDRNVGDLDKNARDFLKQHFVDPVNAVLVNSGIRNDYQLFDDSRLTPQNCKNTVLNFSCSQNDIVVFYYIGHGGRSIRESDSEHPWPKMWLGQDNPNMMLDLKWVHDQLKSKNPRLLLTIGMCCNVKQNLPVARTPQFSRTFGCGSRRFSAGEEAAIKKLFLQSCGDVIATSASPGESSVGGDALESIGVPPMDYYTPLFSLMFNDEISNNSDVSWNGLFTKLSHYFTNDLSVLGMTPIHKANITISSPPVTNPNPTPAPQPSPVIDPSNEIEALSSLEIILEHVRTSHDDSCALPVFTNDCLVKIIAEDGFTVVHRQPISDFLLRLSTSRRLLLVTPVNCKFAGTKCSELHVMEYYSL